MKTRPAFARAMVELYGVAGEAWLAELPALLLRCQDRWGVTIGEPFELSYNYVAAARRHDGTEVVVKIGVPNPERTSEIEALQLYDGDGMVRLLAVDTEVSAMLLERVSPGTPLAALEDDDKATIIAADIMQRLRRPVPEDHALLTVTGWAQGLKSLRTEFDGGVGPFPAHLVERAEEIFAAYLAAPQGQVVLHGDFHHDNVLAGTRLPWLIIDPKGLVGEPAYEVGAYLRNYLLDKPNPKAVLARRIDIFQERLGFDRERILNWGLAVNLLSAWWSYEDHGHGWESAVAVVALCDELE